MLVLSADIQGKAAGLAASTEPSEGIKPLLVGSAIIVHDGLAKMKAIPQWGTTDTKRADVDAFDRVVRLEVGGNGFGRGRPQLSLQSEVKLECFAVARSIFELGRCLGEDSEGCGAGPGA